MRHCEGAVILVAVVEEKVSRMTLSRISENALLRSRRTSFHHLSSFWDGKYDPNLQSIFHEYGRQSFDLESRNLIVSKSSQAKAKIMRKSIGIHFIQRDLGVWKLVFRKFHKINLSRTSESAPLRGRKT